MKKKSIVLSSIVLGLAVLGLLFWVLPINMGISMIAFMNLFFEMMSSGAAEAAMFAIPMLLTLIFNLIIIAFGIVTLLKSCGVVKSAKLAKAFRIVDIVLVSVATAFLLFLNVGFASQGGLLVGMLIVAILYVALIVLTSIDLKVGNKLAKEQETVVAPEEEKAE